MKLLPYLIDSDNFFEELSKASTKLTRIVRRYTTDVDESYYEHRVEHIARCMEMKKTATRSGRAVKWLDVNCFEGHSSTDAQVWLKIGENTVEKQRYIKEKKKKYQSLVGLDQIETAEISQFEQKLKKSWRLEAKKSRNKVEDLVDIGESIYLLSNSRIISKESADVADTLYNMIDGNHFGKSIYN